MATFSSVSNHPNINRQKMAIEELNRCRQYTDQLIGIMHNLPHGGSGPHPAADRLLSEVFYSVTCALAVLDSQPQSTQSTPSEAVAGGNGRGCSGKRKGSPLKLEKNCRESKRRNCFRSTPTKDRVCSGTTTTNVQHISPAVPDVPSVPYDTKNTCKAEPIPKEHEIILESSCTTYQEHCDLDFSVNSFNDVQLDCESILLEPGLTPINIQNLAPAQQYQYPTLQVSTNTWYELDATAQGFPPSSPSSFDFDFSDELFQEYLSSCLLSP